MAEQSECAHEWCWEEQPCNEKGWICFKCGFKAGFRPDLDRSETWVKVHSLLSSLHDNNLTYVSNGTMGEIVTHSVVCRCRQENRYDQESILVFLLTEPDMDGHEFWQREAAKWLEQQDRKPLVETASA